MREPCSRQMKGPGRGTSDSPQRPPPGPAPTCPCHSDRAERMELTIAAELPPSFQLLGRLPAKHGTNGREQGDPCPLRAARRLHTALRAPVCPLGRESTCPPHLWYVGWHREENAGNMRVSSGGYGGRHVLVGSTVPPGWLGDTEPGCAGAMRSHWHHLGEACRTLCAEGVMRQAGWALTLLKRLAWKR